MKLRALLITAGIVALALFSCAAPPPPSPPASKFATGPLCTTDAQGNTTLKISVLKSGFYPMEYYPSDAAPPPPGYTGPPVDTVTVANSGMADDLNKAFAIAPLFFQNQLCNLDGVYIDPTGCQNFGNSNICTADLHGTPLSDAQIISASWGFRETPPLFPQQNSFPNGHPGRYIAISAGPWYKAGASGSGVPGVNAPNYHNYAQKILNALLPWAVTAPPAYGAANPGSDISAMSVLAALAHEFGHVLWYDTFRPAGTFASWQTTPWPYDLKTFCHDKFFDKSWRKDGVDPPPSWRQFGDLQNSPAAANVADIFVALVRKQKKASDLLVNIFLEDSPWASPFAAFSPDEDFIETFKFYVLTQAIGSESGGAPHALTSLPIGITTVATTGSALIVTKNIPDDYVQARKSLLGKKTACIKAAFDP